MIYIMDKLQQKKNTLQKCHKMQLMVAFGEIFTTIIWISQYLQRLKYVWSTTSVRINDEYNLENENLQMEGESQEWTSFKDLTYKKENTNCHKIPLDIWIW